VAFRFWYQLLNYSYNSPSGKGKKVVNSTNQTERPLPKRYSKIKIAAVIMTVCGILVFALLVYSVGIREILDGIAKFGFVGFAVILANYFVRIAVRSLAWKLSVHEPFELSIKDTIPAVMIGEAMSSTIPLGILISGTSKAVAVRHRLPLVAGLSSVATENLFYSLITGIYLIAGALLMLSFSTADDNLTISIIVMVSMLVVLISLGLLMVIRQWHFASWICNWVYRRGFLKRILENGRGHVRAFEDLIYGFYRRYPYRFVPICLLEAVYHILGVFEVFFILTRISESSPSFVSAFLLESVSRLVTIVFKLIPFNIGVDEAGAQFIGESLALAAGVGVTLAIIRKGRILFWSAVGWVLIAKRGLSFSQITALAGKTTN
jgi:Lysylphosphatidylglycerol synthase TM region